MADDTRSKLEELDVSLEELAVQASSSQSTGQRDEGEYDFFGEDDGDENSDHASALTREWKYRQNQFYKMGYRDGITEGQKDSAQEGFNAGFRQSVHVGYKWGLVRGITSVLSSLPDTSKESLVPNAQSREGLQDLHNSIKAISAEDALKMYCMSILENDQMQQSGLLPAEIPTTDCLESAKLEDFSGKLLHLLEECPNVTVNEEFARNG